MHNFRKQQSTDATDNGVEKNDYPRATSESNRAMVFCLYRCGCRCDSERKQNNLGSDTFLKTS